MLPLDGISHMIVITKLHLYSFLADSESLRRVALQAIQERLQGREINARWYVVGVREYTENPCHDEVY